MKRPPHGGQAPTETLRRVALRYPEAEEGVACEGTAAEKRTIKARGKAFLFLGATGAMLKLRVADSTSRLKRCARCRVEQHRRAASRRG